MTKAYLEQLDRLVFKLGLWDDKTVHLETKHSFSGAALYANKTICASWSPSGLAFRLLESEAARLIIRGEAKPLRYFEKGHGKKGYAVFKNPDVVDKRRWKPYFLKAIKQTA